MTDLPRWAMIGLAVPLLVLNGWVLLLVLKYFQPLPNILIIATLIAFLLDYPIKFLEAWWGKRNIAVLFVLLLATLISTLLILIFVPVVIKQLNELVISLPSWFIAGKQQLQLLQDWANDQNIPIDVSELLNQLADRVSTQVQRFAKQLLGLAFDTIGSILNIILTVVISFYLALYGERVWKGIFLWLPPNMGIELQQALNQTFHNYFIGQTIVALIAGTVMTLVMILLQVPFGLLFGLGIGLMTLIPFGGTLSLLVVVSLIAWQDIWLALKVFVIGEGLLQVNENVIVPRILGEAIGLNPVWILISLLIGAKLGGLLGALIAVPCAGFVKQMGDCWRESQLRPEAST
ncbi:AI-2E family transporter [Trichothermofontia sp.]